MRNVVLAKGIYNFNKTIHEHCFLLVPPKTPKKNEKWKIIAAVIGTCGKGI